jgi:lysophospholipase L1-like esterase
MDSSQIFYGRQHMLKRRSAPVLGRSNVGMHSAMEKCNPAQPVLARCARGRAHSGGAVRWVVLCFFLLGGLLHCAGTDLAESVGAGVPRSTYRIMAVGDSITAGGSSFVSYLYPLRQKLLAAGYSVELVGSRTNHSPIGPIPHEGYSGKTVEFLASAAAKTFREYPADIVLLHAGHNHTAEEQPVPGIVAATEYLIGALRAANSRVIVMLAQVIPSGKLPKYAYLPLLNQELGKLAAQMNTVEQPVILVNQAEGFDWSTDTIDDHVHPNARGAEKMAARWFEALQRLIKNPKTQKQLRE